MTDRGRSALTQSPDTLQIGPSSVHWTGKELVIDVNEWGAPPMVTPVRGRIVLTPRAVTQTEVLLTPDGAHLWRPFAPIADIEVNLTQGHTWRGHGYFDATRMRPYSIAVAPFSSFANLVRNLVIAGFSLW